MYCAAGRTVCGVHGNAAHIVVTHVLRDLQHEANVVVLHLLQSAMVTMRKSADRGVGRMELVPQCSRAWFWCAVARSPEKKPSLA